MNYQRIKIIRIYAFCIFVFSILSNVKCIIDGYSMGRPGKTLTSYDMSTQEWTTLQPMSEKRDCHVVCLQGDRILAAGGDRGPKYLDTCEAFDTKSKRFILPRGNEE